MIYPRTDIFDLCNINDATFWPMHRQELSRTAGGATQAKDLGSALWQASFSTSPARRADAAAIEAGLISLNGSAGSFLAHDVRRPFPIKHPGGYSGSVTIAALSSENAFEVTLTGSVAGLHLTPGDYIGFEYAARPSRALHLITDGGEIATAGGSRAFTVFPPIRPGAQVGAAVTVSRAACEMILTPGQSAPRLRDLVTSSLSFSAIQIL